MRLPLVAIFFMSYFYKAGRWHPCSLPQDPLPFIHPPQFPYWTFSWRWGRRPVVSTYTYTYLCITLDCISDYEVEWRLNHRIRPSLHQQGRTLLQIQSRDRQSLLLLSFGLSAWIKTTFHLKKAISKDLSEYNQWLSLVIHWLDYFRVIHDGYRILFWTENGHLIVLILS